MNKYKVEIKSEFCNDILEIESHVTPFRVARIAVDRDYINGRAKVKVTNIESGRSKYYDIRPSFTVHASTEEDFKD